MTHQELLYELRRPRLDEAQLEVLRALLAGLAPSDTLCEPLGDCVAELEDRVNAERLEEQRCEDPPPPWQGARRELRE